MPPQRGRPTRNNSIPQENASSGYYADIDNVLKLLIAADQAAPTERGEAHRFYNMFRDSRISRDDARTKQFNIDESVPWSNKDNAWAKAASQYLGAGSDPLLMPRSLIEHDPNIGFGVDLDSRLQGLGPNDVAVVRNTDTSAYPDVPPFYAARMTDGRLNQIELNQEQFDLFRNAMRAAIPLPTQLQSLIDHYSSPNYVPADSIRAAESSLPNTPLRVALANYTNSQFADSPFTLAKVMYRASQPNINYNLDKFVTYPLTFHEYAHVIDGFGEDVGLQYFPSMFDDEYSAAREADISARLPSGFDPSRVSWAAGNGWTPRVSDEFITDYSASRSNVGDQEREDFAERFEFYMQDKRNGYVASSVDPSGRIVYYRFADIWPNTAQFFDAYLNR